MISKRLLLLLLLPFFYRFSFVSGGEPIALTALAGVSHGVAKVQTSDAGVVQAVCPVTWQKYDYFVMTFDIKPFVLKNRALAVTVQSKDFKASDSFYIKGLDAQGRVAASFYCLAPLNVPTRLVGIPGRTYGRMQCFADDVKSPAGTPITRLQLFFGRIGPAKPIECRLSGVEVIPVPVGPPPEEKPEPVAACSLPPLTEGKIALAAPSGVSHGVAKVQSGGDGSVQAVCPVTWQKYDYFAMTFDVKPFVLKNRALAVTVQSKDFKASDSFYIKGLDAQGRVAASFYCLAPLTVPTKLVGIHGRTYGRMQCFADDVKSPAGTPITRLQLFFGRVGPAKPIECRVSDVEIIPVPQGPAPSDFQDLGVGIAAAELRFCVAALDAGRRPVAAAVPLDAGRHYLLLTELDRGRTFQLYPEPAVYGAAYGGVLTAGGKLVYGVGGKVLIFDLNTRKFTAAGEKLGEILCGAESPDGTVYLGSAPHVRLIQVDTKNGSVRDCGPMDDTEHYLETLAVDKNGVVYCGIGTARANIVAWNPATGRRTQLLPEALRTTGCGRVMRGIDGFVYILFGNFRAKCLGGQIVAENTACTAVDNRGMLLYGTRRYEPGDGSKIMDYNLEQGFIDCCDVSGTKRRFPISYRSGGLEVTSLSAGPDGNVYFSSAHPHHLGRVEPKTGKITDLGYNPVVGGGNFCNMTAVNGKLYACEYSGGRMWEYSPDLPVMLNTPKVENFGIPFATLLADSAADNGRWSEVPALKLLLGIGQKDANKLTLRLPVPRAGRWYLNGQFYCSEAYGTVAVRAGDKSLTCNVQAETSGPGKVWSLGPLELPAGVFPVEFSISANAADNNSRRLFSLIGLELATSPRAASVSEKTQELNPRILGRWPDLATRPRTIAVHPDGKTLVMAGYANYGMVGGGFGVHQLDTGANRAIANFLPGESCIALGFFPDGTMYGSTCTEAPGGGHTTAPQASVFHYDLTGGKLLHRVQLPCRTVNAVIFWRGMIYAAGIDAKLYRIDPKTWQIVAAEPIEAGGAVPRNALLTDSDGKRLFFLQQRLIWEILPDGRMVILAVTPHSIFAGGAVLDGKIYYAHSTSQLGCWRYQPDR